MIPLARRINIDRRRERYDRSTRQNTRTHSPGVGLAPHRKKKQAFQNHDLKDFSFHLLGVDATTSCHANDFGRVLGVFWGCVGRMFLGVSGGLI